MAAFQVGDWVRMPGIPILVEVLETRTCRDGVDCPLGTEIFRYTDPGSGKSDWTHSSQFERV